MKKLLLFLFLIYLFTISRAQNILLNGDFEDFYQKPTRFSQIEFLKGVYNPSPKDQIMVYGAATSDFFYLGSFIPPYNDTPGIIEPQSNSGMVGFYGFFNHAGDYREYFYTSLKNPLKKDIVYSVSFYVSNGKYNYKREPFASYIPIGSNGFGVLFTNDSLTQINARPTIRATAYSIDTVFFSETWVKIDFEYQAKGGERFIAFGNFKFPEDIITKRVYPDEFYPSPWQTLFSYYFVDNVSVVAQNTFPLSGEKNHSICKGDSVALIVTGDSVVTWFSLPERKKIAENTSSIMVSPTTTTSYLILGRSDSLQLKVEVRDTAKIPYRDTLLCLGNQLIITEKSSLYDSLQIAPHAKDFIQDAGNYHLIAFKNGCEKEKNIEIKVEDCEVAIDFPNIFTPNGDAKNDVFIPIIYKGILNAKLIIYNRWGGLVYQTNDPLSGWKGLDVSDGVYYWHCHYTDRNNQEGELKSWVQIVK